MAAGFIAKPLSTLLATAARWVEFGDTSQAPVHGNIQLDPITGLPLDVSGPSSVKLSASSLYTSARSTDGDFGTFDMADYDHFEFDVSTTGSGVTFVLTPYVSFDGGANYKAEPSMVVAYDAPAARGAADIVDRTGRYVVDGRGGLLKFTLASLAGTGSPSVTINGRGLRKPMSYLRDYDNRLVTQPHAPQWADISEPVCVDLTNANAVGGNGAVLASGAGAPSNLANALASVTVSGGPTTTAVTLSILTGAVVIWKVNLPAGVFDRNFTFPRLLTSTKGGSLSAKLSGDPTGAIAFSCQPFRVRK